MTSTVKVPIHCHGPVDNDMAEYVAQQLLDQMRKETGPGNFAVAALRVSNAQTRRTKFSAGASMNRTTGEATFVIHNVGDLPEAEAIAFHLALCRKLEETCNAHLQQRAKYVGHLPGESL